MDLKSLLNKEQYEGAITVDGQVLILAGAGSGKTRVLTYRMAHMIEDLDIPPYKILAITFTNKAAKEMRDRVKAIVGDRADDMWISTFHSTCVRILRREIEHLGYKSSFTIYDSSDQKTLVNECMKALNINDKDITQREITGKIGRAKDKMQGPESFKREFEGNFRENKIADVYLMYQKKLKENNAMDFDDLIFKTVELFKKNPDVLEFYQRKFQYIMIDEYQDTNGAQYELVKLLAAKYKNLCVVGDDDQSIYGWRGADISNILNFEKDYPGTKVIKLEQNYRSKGNILDAANVVIANNSYRKDKSLRTEQEAGAKIKIYRAFDDRSEGDFVSKCIADIKSKENRKNEDFAILYRTNAQSRIFEETLRRRGIGYKIVGGTRFYDRKEIKDLISYLKVLVNLQDDISLRRIVNVPKRSIGDATINKVQDFAESFGLNLWDALTEARSIPALTPRNATCIEKFTSLMENFLILKETVPVSVLIESILKDTGYLDELGKSDEIEDKSRIENLKELVSDAVDFERSSEDKSLEAYLEKVSLVQDTDKLDEDEDGEGSVVLMTIHSAKGLEFPVVFMVGMENGLFPSLTDMEKEDQMEESRRLCYVAITRAKETLYMTSAEVRKQFGRTVSYSQSDFIGEIKSELKEYINERGLSSSSSSSRVNNNSSYSNPHSLRGGVYNSRITSRSGITGISGSTPVSSGSGQPLTSDEATLGRKVKHDKFGNGTIVSVTPSGNDKKLTIAFDKQGVKILALSLAKLELL
ncbi:DNA helicase PcrA [Clostridium sp. LP20]|uniref:DNA helicase PcrA n=1 Tax=Clostridium sp. LP20 TaxID=3418665 RepID=UPI003EE57AB1